jgi:hypothetical protein
MQTKQMKRDKIAELTAARAKLTPTKQLKELDTRLGKGVGAVKERARLAKQIKEAKATKATKGEEA